MSAADIERVRAEAFLAGAKSARTKAAQLIKDTADDFSAESQKLKKYGAKEREELAAQARAYRVVVIAVAGMELPEVPR